MSSEKVRRGKRSYIYQTFIQSHRHLTPLLHLQIVLGKIPITRIPFLAPLKNVFGCQEEYVNIERKRAGNCLHSLLRGFAFEVPLASYRASPQFHAR